MDKTFDFVKKLDRSFFEMFGYPTIEFHPNYCDVKFVTPNTIRSLEVFKPYVSDEFRIYADSDGNLVIIFTFYTDL